MNDLSATAPSVGASFNEITQLIITARQRAVQAVNIELIELHWQVGGLHQPKDRSGGVGGWSGRSIGYSPRVYSTGIARFYQSQSLSHAQVLRGIQT